MTPPAAVDELLSSPPLCSARLVTVDDGHIRPSTPPIRDTNFVLLEKVDAFYDFEWWTGVITKKLADNRYIVFFKHNNKEREFSHLELKLHVESNSVKQHITEDKASMMKRTKVTNGGIGSNDNKHLKSCSNKLNTGITFDDQILLDVGPSKEVNNLIVGETELLSRGKRMLIKREKNIGFSKSPIPLMITSARKKGRSSDDFRVVKSFLPEGGEGDSMKIKTPKSVEKVVHVSKEVHPPPITCVMGLQCNVVTNMLQTKNVNVKSPTMIPPNEGKEADGGSGTLKRKRGRPFKSKLKKPKTPLAVTMIHENEDASPLTKTPVEKVPNTTIKKYQSVKGKRGKRRKIKSINMVSPHSLEDSSPKLKQKPRERLGLGLGLELTTLDEDQPLSTWFEGKQRNGGEKLPFEKRSTTLWETLEAMDIFQKLPQNPHFRPLEKEKECTREGHAISKMVSYVRIMESISQQLTLEDRRSVFEESIEALLDLESHGFDVKVAKERVSGLLKIKEKQELLEQESKKVKKQMEVERVEGVRIDKEIELVDQQVVVLLERRAQVLKRKEKKDAEVEGLEAQMEEIHRGISEARCKFDGLAASSLCG
ncbi:DUF724 domain-containing protein 2 isoform X1 [Lactuca sativa]|nr:DUF724 domain-containing protein 2 isoform X1 [Lactuca sativa]